MTLQEHIMQLFARKKPKPLQAATQISPIRLEKMKTELQPPAQRTGTASEKEQLARRARYVATALTRNRRLVRRP